MLLLLAAPLILLLACVAVAVLRDPPAPVNPWPPLISDEEEARIQAAVREQFTRHGL